MCSRRRKAPSVPASLQRSASASNRRFSLPENWRRLAIATTSGSRRAPSPEVISPVALPAPSATASEKEPDNPFREDFTNEVMFMSTCTLNCQRQVSHLTLARGAVNGAAEPVVNVMAGERRLNQITAKPRQAFLLISVEGFSESNAARILDVDTPT